MGHSSWKPELESSDTDTIFVPSFGEEKAPDSAMTAVSHVGKSASALAESLTRAEETTGKDELLFEIFQLIHQVNNHLQVITINAEMLEMMAGDTNRYVGKILDTSNLMRELMDLFRDQRAEEHQQYSGMQKQMKLKLGMG